MIGTNSRNCQPVRLPNTVTLNNKTLNSFINQIQSQMLKLLSTRKQLKMLLSFKTLTSIINVAIFICRTRIKEKERGGGEAKVIEKIVQIEEWQTKMCKPGLR